MKKIAHIVESTATGTLSVLAFIANQHAKDGHEVHVLYSVRRETPSDLSRLFESTVRLHPVQMRGKSVFLAAHRIRKFLKLNSPNIVLCHSSIAGFLGRIAGIALCARFFYMPHCISIMRRDITWIKRFLFAAGEIFASLKRCDYIAVSRSEQLEIQRYIPFRKCHLVENAINYSAWHSDQTWTSRKKRVVTVGGIRDQKGPEDFADIAVRCHSEGLDLEFVWVGDGTDQELKSKLEKANVEVTGWKSQAEIKKILEDSQVYLSTSRWEGLPISPLESMAAGCLNVLSSCAGNIDIVEHGRTGLLFNSIGECVHLLKSVLKEGDALSLVASAGAEQARLRFSSESYFCKLNSVLELHPRHGINPTAKV